MLSARLGVWFLCVGSLVGCDQGDMIVAMPDDSDVEVASLIADGAIEHELRRRHTASGGRILVDDVIAKCLAGLTTPEEVGRVALYA